VASGLPVAGAAVKSPISVILEKSVLSAERVTEKSYGKIAAVVSVPECVGNFYIGESLSSKNRSPALRAAR
jgi:hypothetical protein